MKARILLLLFMFVASLITVAKPTTYDEIEIEDIPQLEETENTIPTYSETTMPSLAVPRVQEIPVMQSIETVEETEPTAEILEPDAESTEKETEPIVSETIYLTGEERDMLLRIGMCEAGGENCTECIALVMLTVLNRVEDDRFPNTIRDVLQQKNQFAPVSSGWFYNVTPNERCYDALDLVLSGWDESHGCLYFESCNGESWHSKNLEFLFQHCNTRFYK